MLYHRSFKDYNHYVEIQGTKVHLDKHDFKTLYPEKIKGFRKIFSAWTPFLTPGKVLCLGARAGWEVLGAREAGFVGSEGIDLHPGNDTVLQGDWHNIPFSNESFENIFTNSIDHCLNLPKMISEVRRVLTSSGTFFLMATYRPEWKNTPIEKRMAKGLEALFWDHPHDLIAEFERFGFKLIGTHEEHKWHFYFMRKEDGNQS